MGHVFHMISYVDCDVDCDMDSYMPGGGGMLTTDIEASRWSNIYIYIWDYPNPPWELPFLSFFFGMIFPRTLFHRESRFQVTFSNSKLKLSDDVFSPKAVAMWSSQVEKPDVC